MKLQDVRNIEQRVKIKDKGANGNEADADMILITFHRIKLYFHEFCSFKLQKNYTG